MVISKLCDEVKRLRRKGVSLQAFAYKTKFIVAKNKVNNVVKLS